MPHWHEEWSIGAIVRGRCGCSVGGRPLRGGPGDLVAVAPRTVHTGALEAADSDGEVLVVMLYVPADRAAARGWTMPARSGRVRSPALARRAARLESASGVERWLADALPVLGAALDRGVRDLQPGDAARRLLARLGDCLLVEQPTVTRLAERCGVSREWLHRVVRDWVGLSPAEYLRAVRINRARAMLLEGCTPAAAGAACGFADQAHFTRWFRRIFGYTPGDLALAVAGRVRPSAPASRSSTPRTASAASPGTCRSPRPRPPAT
jgi:AraC-like DNA-binding protein